MNKKIIKVLLLLFAFIVVFLLGGLIVLKIKDTPKENNNNNNKQIPKNEVENNYVDEYDINDLLKPYKEISYNSNTLIENIKLYGIDEVDINKVSVQNGRLKFYANDKEYIANNIYNVKSVELITDNETYTELLVYTLYGTYYYNTNGNEEIIDQDAYESKFTNGGKALYTLQNNILNLNFIKVNSVNIVGISKLELNGKEEFIVKIYNNAYLLKYTKTTRFGVNMVTSVLISDKLMDSMPNIEIGKDKKFTVNYDLSLKNSELLKYEDKVLYIDKAYLTKDSYYLISNNNIYQLKLKDFDNNIITKYNNKEIEKITLEEEKTYQGEVITSTKQYIKILYKDGNIEEIM